MTDRETTALATEAPTPNPRLPTGLVRLDALLGGGLPVGRLTLIGSRPTGGKTALLATTISHVATVAKVPTLAFSLESAAEPFTQRLLCVGGQVTNTHLRGNSLSAAEWARLAVAGQRLSEAPLELDDKSTDIDSIARAAHGWRKNHDRFPSPEAPGLIAIDYLQLIASTPIIADRYDFLREVGRRLWQLARRLNVAVVATSQLNRDYVNRADKRPILSDLGVAGALQDEADVVLFTHRAILDDTDASPLDAEIIVAKPHNGIRCIVPMRFVPEQARFATRADADDSPTA